MSRSAVSASMAVQANDFNYNDEEKELLPKKKRNSLQVGLKFPHISAIILLLFTIPLYSELSFVQLLVPRVLFNIKDACHGAIQSDYQVSNVTRAFQSVFVFLPFPIAGWLADAKYGRYKVINISIWLMWWALLALVIGLLLLLPNPLLFHTNSNQCTTDLAMIVVYPLSGILLTISLVLFSLGVAGFLPNILPFIIDQLSEASSSWISSYVRYYSWAQFLGFMIGAFPVGVFSDEQQALLLSATVCFGVHSFVVIANIFCRTLFIQSQSYDDPYKTVFSVVNFARKHKAPVRRSATTYCESGLPSRLDLAKDKYGGPYTNERVENVKTFFRILVVLLSLSGYYIAYSGPFSQLSLFVMHLDNSPNNNTLSPLQLLGIFTNPIVGILLIPIVEIIVRCLKPNFEYYLHKPFMWIGIGFISLLLCNGSLAVISAVGSTLHAGNASCFLKYHADTNLNFPSVMGLIEIPSFLFGFADILVYTFILYFIVCQAPSSMRGMLVGLFLLLRGSFSALGDMISLIFAIPTNKYILNCSIWFWLTLTMIGTASFPLYLWVAKWYRKRERQEIVNYRSMIESVIVREIQHDEDIEKLLTDQDMLGKEPVPS